MITNEPRGGFVARMFPPPSRRGSAPVAASGCGREWSPIPPTSRRPCMLVLRRELLTNDEGADPLDVLLKFTGHADLVASIQRVEATAALVQWISVAAMDGEKPVAGDTEAVSLLLTGLDDDADEKAIGLARGGEDAAGRGLPHPDVVFEELRAEVRPCVATLCVSPRAAANPALKAACEALAQAFFEVLGVEGNKAEFERGRR